MKRLKLSFLSCLAIAASLLVASCSNQNGPIKTEVPERPAGQQDMIGYADAPIDTIRVGIVGLGARGSFAVWRYTYVPWTKITAICDVEPDRVEKSAKVLAEKGLPEPAKYSGYEGYKELCASEDVDLVYVCTDWAHHVPVALCAMENGKHTAIEVPSATSLQECWDLVNTSERTRRHCVILENCCYDFFELSALELARRGALGEILHAEGSYHHNLSEYWDRYWSNWRLDYNMKHKGDVYSTHGFGPVCQALDINRGDRLTTLVAMETKSVNGKAEAKKRSMEGADNFQNGDLTCTLINTENGKSILIEHDVMTPRPYSRMYQLVGTKGYAAKYPVKQICIEQSGVDTLGIDYKVPSSHAALPEEGMNALTSACQNPILDSELEEMAKMVGGHGGMDFIMDYRLVYCLHYGLPVDMDVYDLASWCCISELGSISIENGNRPVAIPDFTRGAWKAREGFRYAFRDGTFR